MNSITLGVFGHSFAYEMECVLRLFFPGNKINIVKQGDISDENAAITRIEPDSGDSLTVSVIVRLDSFERSSRKSIIAKIPRDNALLERELAVMLFKFLREKTGICPQWGILTGIRPVKLCQSWMKSGLSEAQIFSRLTGDYLVSPVKAGLCVATGREQAAILGENTCKSFSLYISIPFCPTRCLYCSFISSVTDKSQKLVPQYVGLLCREIEYTGKIAKDMGLRLKAVYMGGGTPTTLSAPQLGEIFTAVKTCFDFQDLLEYTVEAGRPDTITNDKLETMRRFGVDRVSVNPQTMNDEVLEAIGRRHDSAGVIESVEMVKQHSFKCLNMDLIAGLPGESAESFSTSLERVISLSPQNITVHTLTLKRSSRLRDSDNAFDNMNPDTSAMLDYAEKSLAETGYAPYYLYKQKAAVSNLENIGFTKPGFAGAYNILSMHDSHTILAVGAGAVSKLCFDKNQVRRIFNYKYPYEYIENFAEAIKRKGDVYEADH